VSAAISIAAAVAAVAPAPAAVTSYPAAFFAASQPTTALDMVQLLPGFTLNTGDQVRGFGGAAGNVIVDGARPASKDDSLDEVLKRIPASSVLRIDLIRGGAPGIDMMGKTVIANVIRRQDIAGKVTLTVTGSRAANGQLSGAVIVQAEKRVGQTAFEGSLRIAKFIDDGLGVGGWVRTDGAGAPVLRAKEVASGSEKNIKATGALETPAFGGKLRVNLSLQIDPYDNRTADTLIPAPGADLELYHQDQDTAELGLRYERAFGPDLRLESYLLQQLGRFDETDDFSSDPLTAALTGDDVTADFALKKTTGESILRNTIRFQAVPSLALQAGIEGDYNWLVTNTRYLENGVVTPLPAADVVVRELRGEAFATATWQARPNLTIEAGVRTEASRITSGGDVISERSLVYPKPRLAISWSPDAADQLRLRIEREVGQLNFDDFTAQTAGLNTGTVRAGNPNLDPGEDWVFEAAYERRFWGAGDATVTLRRYALEDVVDRIGAYSPSGDYDAPGNIGPGTRDEAAFTLTLPTDRLGLAHGLITGVATARRSDVTDPVTGLPRGISGLHALDWEAHFTQGLPRWKASWGVDVFGPWQQTFYIFDEVDTDKQRTAWVGLNAEYKARPDLTLRLDLLNLTDRGFEHSRQVFNGPRNIDGLDFTDNRRVTFGRILKFKLIKSFG
jgi:outer membrane receptor protein involved in Fe transport